MTVWPPTAVWSFLCAIIVIGGTVSSNHGLQTPRNMALNVPWWDNIAEPPIGTLDQNNEEKGIPELSCTSPNPSIFNIMQESKDHCTGEDYKVTFYLQEDQEYIELGSWVIDKKLFNDVLKKYSLWSLTNEKLVPINAENTSKDNKGISDNNKLSNEELNQVVESLEQDTGEDNLSDNMVKGPQSIDSLGDCYNHENVVDTNFNIQKHINQGLFENLKSYINQNDKKYTSISSKFNPKYKHFEVTLPENIYTSPPTMINIHIDEANKNIANVKENMNYKKGSRSYNQDKNIPTEYQILLFDDDVSDFKISDVVDLLLNNGYEVNLNAPMVFNLENSHGIESTQSNLAKDTTEYQKDQENSSNDVYPIGQEEEPFHISAVVSDVNDSECPDSDLNEYVVDTSDEYYNDLLNDDHSKSITVDDLNSYDYIPQARETLKENETMLKSPFMSPKYDDFTIDANLESIPLESIISTRPLPLNKEPKLAISSHEANDFVLEVTPSTITETIPVNTKEPTNNDNSLTCLVESKPSTLPLTIHELMPLATITPSLSLSNHISDSPLPADTSYATLSPLNYENLIAKGKLEENLPTSAKNKLWAQKYVQPIEIPLNPSSPLSKMNLPTYFTSAPVISPSLNAPKTAKFVTQPSMAADFNLNIIRVWPKPSVSQTPITGSSMPFELSEKGLQQLLQLPEIVTVSLSSPEHINSPSEILLSKAPQITEASTSTEIVPSIFDDNTQSSKWNTGIKNVISSTEPLATTAIKDNTKAMQSRQPITLNYKHLQQYANDKQIPALNNTVPNVMTLTKPKTESKTTKAYYTPNINPYLSTLYPTKEDCIKPVLTTKMPMPVVASQDLNKFQSVQPLDKSIYLAASSLTPKSESTPKVIGPIPYSISEFPVTSYAKPFSSTPLPISSYLKTISASPVQPSLSKIKPQKDVMFQPAVVPILPSNFADSMQSYATLLKEKCKTQSLLPCTKFKEVVKPIYEASSDPLLEITSPETVSANTPLLIEPMLKQMPTTSSLKPLSEQECIQFAKPSSIFNIYNSCTSPSKSNVTPLPLSVKPIKVSEAATRWTDKTNPTGPVFQTTSLPKISLLPSEVCSTTMLGKEINNFKPVFFDQVSGIPGVPLWSENKIPIGPLPTMLPPSNSILQSNLLETLPASPYIISNNKELIHKTSDKLTPTSTPILNAVNNQNISPLKCSDSLVPYKTLPTYYVFQPKPADDIAISPVADYATSILSPLNSLSFIRKPYSKPSTPALLTTQYTPISSYTFQPHLPSSDISPPCSKDTPMHTISYNFVTPISNPKSPISEDISQTLPLISPMKEIFSSGSPHHFAKPSSVASSTPLSSVSHYSPLFTKKVSPSFTLLPLVNSPSISTPITPIVPPTAHTSPLIGTIMKKPISFPSTLLQNEQMFYPMLPQYTPISVNKPLQGKMLHWKPINTLPNLSVGYNPMLKENAIEIIPTNHVTSSPLNQQYVSKQQIPLHAYKYQNLSISKSYVPSIPKSTSYSFWSQPHGFTQYSEKDIPTPRRDNSHGVQFPLSSPDFSTKSKPYPLSYAESLSDLTPFSSYNFKTSPLNSIRSEIKPPTYSTLLSTPINNQIIARKLSTPINNVSPIETATQMLQPLDTDKVTPSPETLTLLPLSISNNIWYKQVHPIIRPLQSPEPKITPIKALFSNNLQSQVPYKDENNKITYSSQVMTPTETLSELKDVTSQTLPYIKPNIIAPCKWSETVSPVTEIPQMKTLPLDSTVSSNSLLATKYNLPVFSSELKPTTSVLPASTQENKLPSRAFPSLSSLLLPIGLPSQYRPLILLPGPIKPIYPTATGAHSTLPLNNQQTLKPSSLPTTNISYTSIQPLFTPTYNQIPSKKTLDISPFNFATLDVAKHIPHIASASLPIDSKSKCLQYTDWSLNPLSESKYIEYIPASSISMNPSGRISPLYSTKSPFNDFAPVLVSPLQPPELETNFLIPPLSQSNSLLNFKNPNPLLTFSSTPPIPVILPPHASGHYVKPILLQSHISSPANLKKNQLTAPFSMPQPLQPMYSSYTTLFPKLSTPIPILSKVKPLSTITSPCSVQSLFTPKLSVPSAASVTNSVSSFKELHNPSNVMLNPQRLTPVTTPFDSMTLPSNIKIVPTSPLDSVKPETMQSYQWASPISTSLLHNTHLPTPITSPTSTSINTISNANFPVPLPKPIRYSASTFFPVRSLPIKYTEFTPKTFPFGSLVPCSIKKNAPMNPINPLPLPKYINIPSRIHSETDTAPIMTPQSSPIFPIHRTFASTPISYAQQPSSSMSKSFLPLNTVSPSSLTSVQQPYSSTKCITPKVPSLYAKLNNIPEISPISSTPAIPVEFPPNPLIPISLQVNHISPNAKLSTAEDSSSLSIYSPVNPVSKPPFLQYKTLSTTPNNLLNPSSIIKPSMYSVLSESRNESPITVSPIQNTYKQYSIPLSTPSRTVTKYSSSSIDTSKWTPITSIYVTPSSAANSIITSNLQLTPQEISQYNTLMSKFNFFTSPLKTIKPCNAIQRLPYLSPNQAPVHTPNYIANLATNTLFNAEKSLSSHPYSNVILNSAKDSSPTLNAKCSPLSSTQYKSIQPLILSTINSVVNSESKSTTVPIKSFSALPFTNIPQSNIPYKISSPTPFSTPISSTLDSSPYSKTNTNIHKTKTPMNTPLKQIFSKFDLPQNILSIGPVVSQALKHPLITNIDTPGPPSTQTSPSKFTPYSTYVSSKENNFATPADLFESQRPRPLTKVNLSSSNIEKPIMYEQPLPYKLMNIENLAKYYYNPSYSTSTFSNDNICKPLHSINDQKSSSFKTEVYPNLYSNTLTAVPTWKELPVNPRPQPAAINTRYIDDSMFKTYTRPSNYISNVLNLETLQYEPYDNKPKSSIPITCNNVVPLVVQNYINNNENIKSVIQAKTDTSIPLGNILIANKECTNHETHAITPSFGLRMWPSNITIVEAKLQLKFKDITVNNFQPIVNELGSYDVIEIQNLVKNYIRNKYGDVIVVPNNYSLNSQYDVIKDCSSNCNNRCNLLWPMDTPSQWGKTKLSHEGIL